MITPRSIRTDYFLPSNIDTRDCCLFQQSQDDILNLSSSSTKNGFIMGAQLGEGSKGTRVVAARHKDSDLVVAIKIMIKPTVDHIRWGKLQRECAVHKLLDHPRIAKLYDTFEDEHSISFVLEYVEGGDLFSFVETRSRDEVQFHALRIFYQILCAVQYCHDNGVMHRDIKLENITLESSLDIKLIDFGLARYLVEPSTLMTSYCGSPNYISPEMILNKSGYNPKQIDVWALGVVLFAIYTRSLPFNSDNVSEVVGNIVNGLYEVPSYVPQDIKFLIDRMLVVDPKYRATIPELLDSELFDPYRASESLNNLHHQQERERIDSLSISNVFANDTLQTVDEEQFSALSIIDNTLLSDEQIKVIMCKIREQRRIRMKHLSELCPLDNKLR